MQDLIKELQKELNKQGEKLTVDGELGPKTLEAMKKFDFKLIIARKPESQPLPEKPNEGLTPLQWLRGELGQKEIKGSKDNPRIRWYHTHCANIGSKEHADEVAWCSSVLNAAADETGYHKTDNALAISWAKYGQDTGENVPEGAIVVLDMGKSYHVTLADKAFNRKNNSFFSGIGGNQSDSVKVTTYPTKKIVACRNWLKKS